jgi:hypothetical protein
MPPLVMREIRDNIVSVVASCLVGVIIIVLAFFFGLFRKGGGTLVPWVPCTPALWLALCGLGISQMYGDRANRISSLLSTQGVTRNRIFCARVLAGALTVLASLIPALVGTLVLLWVAQAPLEFFQRMTVDVSITLLLAALACYCIGLLVGWTTSKGWPLVGGLFLMALVGSLIAIKGFGPATMGLLLLFIGAILLRTWHKFTSASL